jgi:hypothetical protein
LVQCGMKLVVLKIQSLSFLLLVFEALFLIRAWEKALK